MAEEFFFEKSELSEMERTLIKKIDFLAPYNDVDDDDDVNDDVDDDDDGSFGGRGFRVLASANIPKLILFVTN
jgi:hypothetical protein